MALVVFCMRVVRFSQALGNLSAAGATSSHLNCKITHIRTSPNTHDRDFKKNTRVESSAGDFKDSN